MVPYIILTVAVVYLAVMAWSYRTHNSRIYSDTELKQIRELRHQGLVDLARIACYLMLLVWIAAMILMSAIAMGE